jgi:hypothetical protein
MSIIVNHVGRDDEVLAAAQADVLDERRRVIDPPPLMPVDEMPALGTLRH